MASLQYYRQWSTLGTRSYPLAFSSRQHLSRWSTRLAKLPGDSPSSFRTSLYSATDGRDFKSSYSPNLPYEILPLQNAVDILGRSPEHLDIGLSNQQAEKILEEVGFNSLPSKRKTSIWELWLQQFDDGLVRILVGVAILSAAFSASEAWSALIENVDESSSALSIFLSNEEMRSNVIQSFVEPGIIIAILLLNAAVGVWQDLSARSSLEALEKMQPRLATVLRNDGNGNSDWISDYDAQLLVPGDVILCRVGDSIPADSRLIDFSSSTMYLDESSLTGESVSVSKLPGDEGLEGLNNNISTDPKTPTIPIQNQSGMLFSGSLVTRGKGKALVVRTGTNTQIGKIQSTLFEAQDETEERKTPLGEQLDRFGLKLSYIIGFICLVVWVTSIPRFSGGAFDTWLEGAVYYAKVSVALGVAAIPEGLPAVITLCLSLGTRRMAEKNVIVRKLPSVETLGCTTVICTDKTGTLTSNQMTGVSIAMLESQESSQGEIEVVEHGISGSSYNPSGSVDGIERDESSTVKDGAVQYMCEIMSLCNDSRLIGNDDFVHGSSDSNPQYSIEGEPTEAALAVMVEKLGPYATEDAAMRPSVLANQNRQHFCSNWKRYATLEFDRKRKSMSVLCAQRQSVSQRCMLFCKGAPNMILERCTHAKLRDGCIIPLDQMLKEQIKVATASFGDRALRCIGLAYSEEDRLDPSLLQRNGNYDATLKDSNRFESIESGMTFVGLCGIRDPPRPNVWDSVDICIQAGIRVIMITGDDKATAIAIAKDVHIFGRTDASCKDRAFEGREFFALSETVQRELLTAGNLVICRAEPVDKQNLVRMLQSLGEIPAMTGDGVNDAPALQQASIGVSMGISGTDVAKEAADMVIADDRFSTIVDAVEEGRCIYANMQAFINFLITCNIGEVIGVFLASILGFPQLLTPLQLLWVNLVTDGPPAIALGFNPPSPDLMKRKPRSASEEILTSAMIFRYTTVGLYIGVATLGIYASYFLDHGVSLREISSWSSCTDSPICDIYSDIRAPQTLALSTLVTTELLKALCTVSVSDSIFVVGPQRNPWLMLGVAVPFALNLAIVYTPALEKNFGLVHLSGDDWIRVFLWSLPVVIIEEALKLKSKIELDDLVDSRCGTLE